MTPEQAARLKKLLPMLSSSQDGEVVAAARAIGKLLRAAGIDWHDLARAAAGAAPAAPAGRPYTTYSYREPRPHFEDDVAADLRQVWEEYHRHVRSRRPPGWSGFDPGPEARLGMVEELLGQRERMSVDDAEFVAKAHAILSVGMSLETDEILRLGRIWVALSTVG